MTLVRGWAIIGIYNQGILDTLTFMLGFMLKKIGLVINLMIPLCERNHYQINNNIGVGMPYVAVPDLYQQQYFLFRVEQKWVPG